MNALVYKSRTMVKAFWGHSMQKLCENMSLLIDNLPHNHNLYETE